MTFATWALDKYAGLMVRGICVVRRFVPANEDPPPTPDWLFRDFEWFGKHFCAIQEKRTRHHFIEWVEGDARVTTAECQECGLEGTV